MNKHATDIVAYLGPIGFILAFLLGDRSASRFHLNQSLNLCICSLVLGVVSKAAGLIPLLGFLIAICVGLISFVFAILWLIAFIDAIRGVEKPVPVVGWFQLL